MKKYEIVISRYNEDVSWVKNINTDKFNVKLYNKGQDNIDYPFIQLENFGRDSHSYITYIVDNYNNLPEYVIFLQGKPFDHCKNVMELINNHTDEDYVFLSDHILDENLNGWYEHLVEKNMQMNFPEMRRYSLRETANAILGDEVKEYFKFSTGQQYIMHKKYILNRSLDFYKNLLERFKFDFVLPWHIERIWFSIFKF